MKQVRITRGRCELLLDRDYLKLMFDGAGLSIKLSKEEMLRLSKALWYEAR